MAKISQREARALKRRVAQLENDFKRQRESWIAEWPGGVHIDNITVQHAEWHIAKTARRLGHAVVVVPGDQPQLKVYACPLLKTP
jgi:hypothetical protein